MLAVGKVISWFTKKKKKSKKTKQEEGQSIQQEEMSTDEVLTQTNTEHSTNIEQTEVNKKDAD